MNKKRFFPVFFLLTILLFSFVYALDEQGITQSAENLEDKVDNISKILDDPAATKDELRAQYLRKEWFGSSGMLAKNPIFGSMYRVYLSNQQHIDPFFLFTFGLAPNFSWLFFLNFIIVICLMTYFFRLYEVLRDFSTFSSTTAKVISLGLLVILMAIGFFRILATILSNLIINLISSLNSIPMQIIGVVICIFFFIFVIKFSKQIKIYMKTRSKEDKEMYREMEGELAIEKLKTWGKVLDEGFKDGDGI